MLNKMDRASLSAWKSILLSLWGWISFVVITITCSCSGLIFFLPFSILFENGSRRMMHGVAVIWAQSLIAFSPLWSLRVEGKENIQKAKPYVIVANHQSVMDIFAALAGIPVHFKFIAKDSLFSLPFMGWHMTFASYIPVDRSSRESGRRAMITAREWLKKGVSVLFFPEGTRSMDGQIHEFKNGAFRIAQEVGVDILPVIMDGTGDAIPKKSWRIRKEARLFVSVGKPVATAGVTPTDALKEIIRNEMIGRLAQVRARSR